MNNDKRQEVVNINFFKKIWLSITKFERYPEMATEGVSRAILYLAQLILIFSIIISIGALFKFNSSFKEIEKYINTNIATINYENGKLDLGNKMIKEQNEVGTIIIDTSDQGKEKQEEYEKSISNNVGIIWLQDQVELNILDQKININYKDLFEKLDIQRFDKQSVIQFIQNFNSPQIYLGLAGGFIIYIWIVYFTAALINVLILSVFGWITLFVASLKIRYRALFNMSIYAITISSFLQAAYIFVNLFISFQIKYFDIMYTAISYICLLAAIFMIKADVIKAQIEMIKMVEKKKQEQEEPKEEKEDETEKQDDKDKESDEEKKEEKESGLKDVGEQGSNA